MESLFGGGAPAEPAPEVRQSEILKQGWLEKQSRWMKTWRKRYVILMKTHMLTFKDASGDYTSPTEIIPINECCTVKSADDELNLKNSFKILVKDQTFYFLATDNSEKESWIGGLGKAMIKTSVMIDKAMEGAYM